MLARKKVVGFIVSQGEGQIKVGTHLFGQERSWDFPLEGEQVSNVIWFTFLDEEETVERGGLDPTMDLF
jgi:hypothetical protein